MAGRNAVADNNGKSGEFPLQVLFTPWLGSGSAPTRAGRLTAGAAVGYVQRKLRRRPGRGRRTAARQQSVGSARSRRTGGQPPLPAA